MGKFIQVGQVDETNINQEKKPKFITIGNTKQETKAKFIPLQKKEPSENNSKDGYFINAAKSLGSSLLEPSMDYIATTNKVLAKGADAIGWDGARDYLNENVHMSNQTSDRLSKYGTNKTFRFIGNVLGDPINAAPGGVFIKGGKFLPNMAKSLGYGTALGATTSLAKDYGNKKITPEQMRNNAILSGIMWGGLNTAISGVGTKIVNNRLKKLADENNMQPQATNSITNVATTTSAPASDTQGFMANLENFGIRNTDEIQELKQAENQNINKSTPIDEVEEITKTVSTNEAEALPQARSHGVFNLQNKMDVLKQKYPELVKDSAKSDMRSSFINNSLSQNLASGVSGAGVGAYIDDENRLRGAGLGLAAGMLGADALQKFVRNNMKKLAIDMLPQKADSKTMANSLRIISNLAKPLNIVGKEANYSEKINDLIQETTNSFKKIKNPTQDQKDMLELIKGARSLIGINRKEEVEALAHFIETGYQKLSRDGQEYGIGLKHLVSRHYGAGAEGELTAREILNIGKTIQNGNKFIPEQDFREFGSFSKIWGYSRELPVKKGEMPIRFKVVFGLDRKDNAPRLITYYSNRNVDGGFSSTNAINPPAGNQAKMQDSVQATSVSASSTDDIITNANLSKDKKGFIAPSLAANVATSGSGGIVGSIYDDENRVRGFISGAIAGRLALKAIPTSKQELKDIGGAIYKAITTKGGVGKLKDGDKPTFKSEIAEKLLSNEVNKNFADLSTDGSFITNTINKLKLAGTNTLGANYEALREKTNTYLITYANKMQNLQRGLSSFDNDTRVRMTLYMLGDKEQAKHFTKDIVGALDSARADVDFSSDELVKLGIMLKESADEFKGTFLHRMYENKGIISKIKNHFSGHNYTIDPIKARGKEVKVTKEHFIKLQEEGKIAVMGDKGFSEGGKFIKEGVNKKGNVVLRRDYTKEEREKMGEILDISTLLPKTLYRQHELKAHHQMLKELNELAKKDGGNILPDSALIASIKGKGESEAKNIMSKAGYVKFAKDNKYGVLQGQWIRKDIASDIKGQTDRLMGEFYGLNGVIPSIARDYGIIWRKSLTVYNSVSHVNNFSGNAFIMSLADIPIKDIKKMGSNAVIVKNANRYLDLKSKRMVGNINANELKELKKLEPMMKSYDEAISVGLFGRSQLNDINAQSNQHFGAKARGALNKIDEFASGLYQAEDNIARLTMYNSLRRRGMPPIQAKNYTNSFLPDYTRYMPPAVKFLRDSGVAPFVSWTYYVLPKMVMAANTKHGARSILTTMAAMNAFSYMRTGILPWSNETPDNTYGRYINLSKDGDKVTRVKIDRIVPYLNYTRNPYDEVSGLFKGYTAQGMSDTLSLLKGKTPERMFDGRAITNPKSSTSQKAYDGFKHFMQSYVPLPKQLYSAYDLAESKIANNKKRKKNEVYIPRSSLQETLKFLGLNTSVYSLRGLKKDRINKTKKKNNTIKK